MDARDKSTEKSEELSYAKGLFFGTVNESKVFPYPEMPREDADTTRMIVEAVEKFAKDNIHSHKIDEDSKIPTETMEGLKSLGLFGMIIPQQYGGLGLSATSYARIMECVAGIDGSCAVTLGAHQSIGLKGILLAANEEQKQRYLPELASGKRVAAFALTEPTSGSDAQSMRCEARLQGGQYILNGSKLWITNGGFADVFTVFAKTTTTHKGVTAPRVSAFIVERSFKGFSNGPDEKKLGIKGSSTAALFFDNVPVPEANLLGEEGRGFKLAMEILNSGRLGLASGCVGASKRMLKQAVAHALERKQFGTPIADFGMIKDKIGRMMIETYAIESMVYMTTAMVDRGESDYSLESAICKVAGSESCWRVVDDCLQIAGGTGYMKEYPYEQWLRDTRINLIFEGTNEILRLFIALAGMQGPGEQLKEVSDALKTPLKNYGLLTGFLGDRIKKGLPSGFVSAQISKADPSLKAEAAVIEQVVADLEMNTTKMFWKHGKKITERQFALKRVADLTIELFAMSCVVARSSRAIATKGAQAAESEVQMARVFVERSRRRCRSIVKAFDKNEDEVLKALADKAYATGGYAYEGVL